MGVVEVMVMSFVVGISNSRLATAKRGIAVELAAQLAQDANTPICLVGADPTDRDVERHLPRLVESWGQPARMEITRGTHHLEIANFPRSRVCVISVSDRESVGLVFPILQQRFQFLVVDAPSRTGFGVGIAGVLLERLDALLIGTGLTAGELAETRGYVERLEVLPGAQHVDRRVLAIGDLSDSGLGSDQLELRLATLPTVGHVPRLGGGVGNPDAVRSADLDAAFRPLVQWIRHAAHPDRSPTAPDATEPASTGRHVANRIYRETFDG